MLPRNYELCGPGGWLRATLPSVMRQPRLSSLRLFALRRRRRRPPAFGHVSHAGFLRGWRRFSRIRLLPAFRHKGHARFWRGWRCFSWNRRNHREGMAGGAGNLPPGELRITFQALPAMGTVEFELAHKGFIAGGTHRRRKRRNRPASLSMAVRFCAGFVSASANRASSRDGFMGAGLFVQRLRPLRSRPGWARTKGGRGRPR